MSSVGCLVMPTDLASKALAGSAEHGWLHGAKRDSEWVYLVVSIELGANGLNLSEALPRIAGHRVLRSEQLDGQLLRWVAVGPGFQEALRRGQVGDVATLIGWARRPAPADEILQEQHFVCCLEARGANPVITFVYVRAGDANERDMVFELDVEPIGVTSQSLVRLNGILPIDELQTKRAAIVGLGSGGGFVAMDLAAAGVGELHLFDMDRLTAANLFRHVCGRSDLGRKKVLAVRDLIWEHDLPAQVVTHDVDILQSADELRATVSAVDVVVGATDGVPSRRLVNYVSVKAGTPLVLAGTFDNARIGEIIRVLPGRTACHECTRLHLREEGSLVVSEGLETDEAIPYSSQSPEEPAPASRGTRTDVYMVAALQTKVTLMTLLGDRLGDTGLLPRNYLTWGAFRNQSFPRPFAFQRPFTVNFVEIPRRPDCPVCGLPPSDLLGLDTNEKHREILGSLAEAETER